MNRLLSLDGGGIRGIFTLQILRRVEEVLRARYQEPDLVLADYFNFIGGTSTGAIIAALLSWGRPVEEITDLYEQFATSAFESSRWREKLQSKYGAEPVREILRHLFMEREGTSALLGSERLRTFLLLVLRNASTGSTWPLTNNPDAVFNRREGPHSNLDLPLWQLIRASSAAPTFFPCETVKLIGSNGEEKIFEFVDGGVSPHNNPSLLMYLMATLPQYRMNFSRGVSHLYLLSVGTGDSASQLKAGQTMQINRLSAALRVFDSLMSAINEEQDLVCRAFGHCIHGPEIDIELGDLAQAATEANINRNFLYCRYNYAFTESDRRRAQKEFGSRHPLALDDLRSFPLLRELGAAYAGKIVREEHLPDAPLLGLRLMKF
jgi:hypothetical protein